MQRHDIDTDPLDRDLVVADRPPYARYAGSDHQASGHSGYDTGARYADAPAGKGALIGLGLIDARSILIAIVCAFVSFALASISLSAARIGDGSLATVWLPAAVAAAFLLRLPLKNELPFFAGLFTGIYCADVMAGFSSLSSAVFALANVAEAVVAVSLIRRFCGPRPAVTNIRDLGMILWFGALISPLASTAIAAASMAFDLGLTGPALINQAINWYLAHGLGIVLLVPAILLLGDLWRRRFVLGTAELFEALALITFGLAASYAVFAQNAYPLLFVIPVITLFHAFRVGALGTALFVGALSVLAFTMTSMGLGPIYEANGSPALRNHVLQAFIAANFLTGLPVAAALAGRKRMIDQLERGKQQLDILANNISDAVLHYDLDGICTYASPSVRDVLGQDPARFVGARFADNMHEDARDRIAKAERQLLTGVSQNERFTYRRFLDSEDGSPVFIEAECAIVQGRGGRTREGMVIAARDVTQRVELELLLTRARRHAENAARSKSEFLANMSHEIRTPMNGVLGFAELLLQSELEDDQRRQAEMIVQSGRSMMMLLNDVLDLSRIEAGQIAIDNAPVDLDATIAECAALHQPAALKKGLEIALEWPDVAANDCDDTPRAVMPWVMTDALRLRQIVLNLIGNAIKFTQSGTITISCRSDGDEFSISVADTGIGISNQRLDMIFNPFTQAEGDTARRFGGTGLGLSISRQLADLLGGRIEVTSEVDVGSCFTLVLPASHAEPSEEPSEPEPETEYDVLEDLPHHARILLAEDHDVNRMLAREMLERCGQTVAVAHDGNEAISMVMDSVMRGSPYDLVLMDMQMPGCDGYDATRAIRAEGITPDQLPIVALTANAFPEDVAAARKAGMQAHLAKPMVFSDLARVLQRWLPTRIVEPGEDQGDRAQFDSAAGPHDSDGAGPDRSEVIDLLHASRAENRAKSAAAAAAKPARTHSPALIKRWVERREEAVEAVRAALTHDHLNGEPSEAPAREALAKLIHKLAGTAAMFDEPELGDQASALENALRMELDPKIQEALAFELLSLADEAAEDMAQSSARSGAP